MEIDDDEKLLPLSMILVGIFLMFFAVLRISCELRIEELGPPDGFGRAGDLGQVDQQVPSSVVPDDLR